MKYIVANKKLPKNITSYDLLKTFAVIIMIIDHVGGYFFLDNEWLRAIGRIGFPVWFFLVGHAKGRDISRKLWGGALILLIANYASGMAIFPMNALFTIIFIRLLLDLVVQPCLKKNTYLYGISVFLVLLAIPSGLVSEYGSVALITAMYGYFVRNKKEINNNSFVMGFMIFSFLVFIIFQQISFGFTNEQFLFMAAGTLFVRMMLFYFDLYEYPNITRKSPKIVLLFMQFCGRYTLEIYVVHLVVFKIVALLLGYDGFGLFEFELVDLSMFDMDISEEI